MKLRQIYNKEWIPVPKVFYKDEKESFLILEDCGKVITELINEDKDFNLQKKVIDILIQIQK